MNTKDISQQIIEARKKVEAYTYTYEKAKEDMDAAICELHELENRLKSSMNPSMDGHIPLNTPQPRRTSIIQQHIIPSQMTIVYNAKETLGYWLFGKFIGNYIHAYNQSSISRIFGLITMIVFLVSFFSLIRILPSYYAYAYILNVPHSIIRFLSANKQLFVRVSGIFEIWYLMANTMIIVTCWCLLMRTYQAVMVIRHRDALIRKYP